MSTEEKRRLISAVNEIMRMHGLQKLPVERLGEAARDEVEIQEVNDFRTFEDNSVTIEFRTAVPNVGERNIAVRYGGSGCVVIPIFSVNLNGQDGEPKVALVKKWRVENGDWSYELPRGRVAAEEQQDIEDREKSPIRRIISATFGEECLRALDQASIVKIGKLDQRGEAASLDIVLFRAAVVQDFVRRPGDGRIVLMPPDQLMKLIDDDMDKTTRVTEVVTTAALYKTARKLGWW